MINHNSGGFAGTACFVNAYKGKKNPDDLLSYPHYPLQVLQSDTEPFTNQTMIQLLKNDGAKLMVTFYSLETFHLHS